MCVLSHSSSLSARCFSKANWANMNFVPPLASLIRLPSITLNLKLCVWFEWMKKLELESPFLAICYRIPFICPFFIVHICVSHIFLYSCLDGFHPIYVAQYVWIYICISSLPRGWCAYNLQYILIVCFGCFYRSFDDWFALHCFIRQL